MKLPTYNDEHFCHTCGGKIEDYAFDTNNIIEYVDEGGGIPPNIGYRNSVSICPSCFREVFGEIINYYRYMTIDMKREEICGVCLKDTIDEFSYCVGNNADKLWENKRYHYFCEECWEVIGGVLIFKGERQ